MPVSRGTASIIGALLAATLMSCGGERGGAGAAAADSTVPLAVRLERFRDGLDAPATFTHGAASRDELVARFAAAVQRNDTAALGTLALTRAEFAWLYYPEAPESAAPYELEPSLMWFTLQTNSGRGLRALLDERGGKPLGVLGHECDGVRRHGKLALWGPCLVRRLRGPGDTVAERLFGPIVERDGLYKFVSFAHPR